MNNSKFQFRDPQLEELHFEENDSYELGEESGLSIESETNIGEVSNNSAYISMTLKIGDGSNNQPFKIVVRMGADFMWDEGIPDEMLRQMMEMNASAVLLSYIRPIVAMVTNSSKYPVLNIPFVDFTRGKK